MPLTRSFRETVVKHVHEDPAFRAALIEEVYRNILEGDRHTALAQSATWSTQQSGSMPCQAKQAFPNRA